MTKTAKPSSLMQAGVSNFFKTRTQAKDEA